MTSAISAMPTLQYMLVTFAVPEEAGPFGKAIGADPHVRVLVTGMGRENARRALLPALAADRPAQVFTCGFAGSLRPQIGPGTVIFSADEECRISSRLVASGARAGSLYCSDRVAITATEKRELRERTGADAVEMESGLIRAMCRTRGIPSATVRVISDAADEDLPLDFNALMDSKQRISYGRLAWALAKAPGKVGALIRFQRQTRDAAQRLAKVLAEVISAQARV